MDEVKERSIERVREEIMLYTAIEAGLAASPGDMNHIHIPLVQHIIKQQQKTVDCVEQGLPIVANSFTNAPEIMTAMDLHWFFIFQAAWGGGMENPHLAEDLEIVDQMGVPGDCCTLLRMGLFYLHAGYLPRPTAYVGITEPCDGIVGVHQAIMAHKNWRGVPSFAPEPPYFQDERSIKYYAGELKRMTKFCEEHTGKKLDLDRLREVVEETNKQYALWMEYSELRRSVPTPHEPVLPQSCFYVTSFPGAGAPEMTDWFESLVKDAEMRVKDENPLVPNQKFRVLWFDIPSVFFSTLAPWLQEELGGSIILDMVTYCPYTLIDTSTEDSIFEGLAKRSLNDAPMIRQARGVADNFLIDINRIVKDFSIDCVIWPGHMGHKDGAASIALMRETCKEIGVPFLNIGLDHIDKRYTSLDDIKSKITRFVRTMGLG